MTCIQELCDLWSQPAEDENLDELLSLFEESQGPDPENSSSKEVEDNLDGLFDDDEDGEVYAEPEEEDATLENSDTGAESEHYQSKEDLEGEISSIPERGTFFTTDLHRTWYWILR